VTVIIGTITIVCAVVVIGVLVDRKVGILPRPEQLKDSEKAIRARRGADYAAGDAPSTAIRARGAQLDKLRSSRRCATCRETLVTAGDDERVRYGDGELLVLHLRCPKCSETRSVYVDATA
jgi:hypothetical protein